MNPLTPGSFVVITIGVVLVGSGISHVGETAFDWDTTADWIERASWALGGLLVLAGLLAKAVQVGVRSSEHS